MPTFRSGSERLMERRSNQSLAGTWIAAPMPSRRHVLGGLGAFAGALALGGCGTTSSDAATSSGGTASSMDYAGAQVSALLREVLTSDVDFDFGTTVETAEWGEKVNANVAIQYDANWRERYVEIARQRKGADIVELFANDAHVYSDRLHDVSDLAEEIGEANGGWVDAARAAVQVDGRWFAIPWAYTSPAVNLRSDLLAEVGADLPDTYDDLLEVATRFSDGDLPRAAFSMSAQAPNDSAAFAFALLWSFGGSEVDTSGTRVILDSAGTRAALQYFRDLSEVSYPDWSRLTEGSNNDAFLEGDISLTLNAPSIYIRAEGEGSPVADEMIHLPQLVGPEGRHRLLEMNSLAVFEHAFNTDVALDWIRFITRSEHLRHRAVASRSFFSPPLNGQLEHPDLLWNTVPALAGLKDSHVDGHVAGWPGPASQEAGLAYRNGSVVSMFSAVGTGEMSIDEAVSTATEALRRVYET